MESIYQKIVGILLLIAYLVGPSLALLASFVLALGVAFWTFCIDPGLSVSGP